MGGRGEKKNRESLRPKRNERARERELERERERERETRKKNTKLHLATCPTLLKASFVQK